MQPLIPFPVIKMKSFPERRKKRDEKIEIILDH